LALLIVLSALGLLLGSSSDSAAETETHLAKIVTGTAVSALPTLANTNTPQPDASPTLKPTATATHTPTHTPTSTPSQTPTQTPTATPVTPNAPTPTPTMPPPLPTPSGIYSWTLRVPILMYHYVSIPPEDADIYRTDLSVAPDNFRSQMQYLAEHGYTTISLYDLSRAITGKTDLPAKPVIITLDDGYLDNYQNAFPILKEYGLTATIFLATDFLDKGNPNYMTWDMVQEMAAYGIHFEPHSKSHSDLSEKSRDFLIWEILGSQQTVQAHTGTEARYFAYPSGRYDETTIQVLQELGFWGAVTTQGGKWHGFEDRYEWRRLRIHNYTTLPDFIDLVKPGDADS
jgi:peptidoglycan/xylan/chitin deacetylase (PgdA/CDA1 family)